MATDSNKNRSDTLAEMVAANVEHGATRSIAAMSAIEQRNPEWVHNAGDTFRHVRSGASLNVFHMRLFLWTDYVPIRRILTFGSQRLIDSLFREAEAHILAAVTAVEMNAMTPGASLSAMPYHPSDPRAQIWLDAWFRGLPNCTAEHR